MFRIQNKHFGQKFSPNKGKAHSMGQTAEGVGLYAKNFFGGGRRCPPAGGRALAGKTGLHGHRGRGGVPGRLYFAAHASGCPPCGAGAAAARCAPGHGGVWRPGKRGCAGGRAGSGHSHFGLLPVRSAGPVERGAHRRGVPGTAFAKPAPYPMGQQCAGGGLWTLGGRWLCGCWG